MMLKALTCVTAGILVLASAAVHGEDAKPKQLLLLGQGPDGHPTTTHEYLAGLKVIEALLKATPNLQTRLEHADEPWPDGPAKLAKADGCVLFLSEGAKWLHTDPRRYDAFTRLAARGGGFVVLHWAMGTKDADNIEPFVRLMGGCHGGPDRRYTVLETQWRVAAPKHSILTAIGPLKVRDEFYYRLKFVKVQDEIQPLITVTIDGQDETVSWAWQRPDGGRSFGFSGLHFHDNWHHEEYRRLVAQAVLWALKLPIPDDGVKVDVDDAILELKGAP